MGGKPGEMIEPRAGVQEIGKGGIKSCWTSTGYISALSVTGETFSLLEVYVGIPEARKQGLFVCSDAPELLGATEAMEGGFEQEIVSRPIPKALGLGYSGLDFEGYGTSSKAYIGERFILRAIMKALSGDAYSQCIFGGRGFPH